MDSAAERRQFQKNRMVTNGSSMYARCSYCKNPSRKPLLFLLQSRSIHSYESNACHGLTEGMAIGRRNGRCSWFMPLVINMMATKESMAILLLLVS